MKNVKIKRNISVRLLLTLVALDHLQSLHMKREAGTNVFTQFSNEYTLRKIKLLFYSLSVKAHSVPLFVSGCCFGGFLLLGVLLFRGGKKLLNKMT